MEESNSLAKYFLFNECYQGKGTPLVIQVKLILNILHCFSGTNKIHIKNQPKATH